ncbi:MAG: tyrosine-protein phosphatase [Huintestinicola sp.]
MEENKAMHDHSRPPVTDIHAHILPCFDDGPKSCSESAEILRKMHADGIERVVATSHFYRHNETIEQFIERRSRAYDELTAYLNEQGITDIPRIIPGAEVYFSPALKNESGLERLCIAGTNYMLTELPYTQLTEAVLREFGSLAASGRVKIILAHIERYTSFASKEMLMRFLECSCTAQVNCDSIIGLFGTGFAYSLIRNGYISALGTDAHNTGSRPPRFAQARRRLISKMGEGAFEMLMASSDGILSDLPLDRITEW